LVHALFFGTNKSVLQSGYGIFNPIYNLRENLASNQNDSGDHVDYPKDARQTEEAKDNNVIQKLRVTISQQISPKDGTKKRLSLKLEQTRGELAYEVAHLGLPHRACAPFLAIALRCSGVRAAARAGPPALPPRRPRETAARFFGRSWGIGANSPCVACWTTRAAIWFMSIFFVERSGIK
jgi:hypothetical protein